MDEKIRKTLALISGEDLGKSVPGPCAVGESDRSDVELLNARSRAVIEGGVRRSAFAKGELCRS